MEFQQNGAPANSQDWVRIMEPQRISVDTARQIGFDGDQLHSTVDLQLKDTKGGIIINWRTTDGIDVCWGYLSSLRRCGICHISAVARVSRLMHV